MTKPTNKPIWRNAITDAVIYNPLTGTYRYTQQSTPTSVDNNQNQFWTPMGQQKRNDQSEDRNEDKKY